MNKPTITYHYDALCGWCFGFSNTVKSLREKYGASVDFQVVSGGLFSGERVGYLNDVAPYVKDGAYLQVEQRTGMKFGAAFIEKGIGNNTMMMDSLPPAIAMCIVREERPEKQMDYAELLLKAFYVDGLSADDLEQYGVYAAQIGVEVPDFVAKMADAKYVAMAKAEFATCAAKGVQGYPAMVLKTETEEGLISNGYADFSSIDDILKQVLGL